MKAIEIIFQIVLLLIFIILYGMPFEGGTNLLIAGILWCLWPILSLIHEINKKLLAPTLIGIWVISIAAEIYFYTSDIWLILLFNAEFALFILFLYTVSNYAKALDQLREQTIKEIEKIKGYETK